MGSRAEDGAAFEHIVPHHDDGGSDELRDHIVDAGEVDEHPHEQLIETEPRDARAEEEHLRAARLCVCAVKDADKAEPIVDEDRDRKRDARREEIVEPAILGEDIEQTVVEDEARTADEDKADDFIESGTRHRCTSH